MQFSLPTRQSATSHQQQTLYNLPTPQTATAAAARHAITTLVSCTLPLPSSAMAEQQQAATTASSYVYLSNLPVDAYEAAIRRAFDKEGIAVAGIKLLLKGSFNRQRNSGLATVQLACAADAERCCELLDGKVLCGSSSSADAAACGGRPMIVRRNKFECCQLGYEKQETTPAAEDGAAAAVVGSGSD